MKKNIILLVALGLLAFTACNKKSPAISYTCDTSAPNKITITDDGNTYNACGDYPTQVASLTGVNVILGYGAAVPSFGLFSGQNNVFWLDIYDSVSPDVTGIGIYTLKHDSLMTFSEHFSGGRSYSVSGGTINLTHWDSTSVAGTFTVNVFNTSGSKTITGVFNANEPAFVY